MGLVKIADLKNNLSRHLAHVRQGGEITVFDRDTPIARIVPFAPGKPAARGKSPDGRHAWTAERIGDLARQGVLSPGDPQAVAEWLDRHPPLRLPDGPGAVDLLLDMRRDSAR